ncbi:MAG: N-acetylmuramoyl-L-alanine amidase, partial [Alphaproteobacteria bacterium]|nr:N-acetylmuramoyl-L-alanine amidase [Alphaproteobacteria bacterium]
SGLLRCTQGLLLAIFSLFFCVQQVMAEPAVTGARIGEHPQMTRFVLDVSEDVGFRVFTLSDPYRVVVDFPELKWDIPLAQDGAARGLIKKYRFGQFREGTSRLVLDLTGPATIRRNFLLPPQGPFEHRFVIDLVSTDRATFMADKKAPPAPTPASPVPVKKPRVGDGKRVVVIDAGHGGIDPGTISMAGDYEKEVTLRAAKELKKRLEATGRYRVVLTRDKDVFIPLRERVEIGRRAQGDLFISLHADAIDNRSIRGATVYTLSETSSDKEAAALARKENQVDVLAGMDLGGDTSLLTEILIDLMQRETMNYSAEFANILIPELSEEVLLRTNTHRFAGFRVLKAPDVPSVLVEMGYLSNSRDAQLLVRGDGVRRIATAISDAVDVYFARQEARLEAQPAGN